MMSKLVGQSDPDKILDRLSEECKRDMVPFTKTNFIQETDTRVLPYTE